MPDLEQYIAMVLFAFPLLITPGPNNIIIATTAANFGIRRAAPAVFGVIGGFNAQVFIIAAGGGFVFSRFPLLHEILRYCSLVFMFYIAYKIAFSGISRDKRRDAPVTFWQMVAFQWINPKAYAMALAATAAFIDGSAGVILSALIVTSAYLVNGLPCQWLWACFGAGIGGYLRAKPIRLRVFNVSMALLMLGAFVPSALN